MKAYIIITGAVFALLTLVHIWRMFVEGAHAATNPFFLAITIIAAALSLWAGRLLMRSTGS